MEIYYLNDEEQSVTVRVNGQLRPSVGNPYGEPQIEVHTLFPKEGRVFFVDAPENAVPYIKRWETRVVMLSYLELKALEVLRPKR
jgi:hypothetical protein